VPFLAFLFAFYFVVAGAAKGRADKELESLQGDWAAVSFEANGQAVCVAQAGWRAIIKRSRVSVRCGWVSFDGDLVLDPSGKQRALDITGTTGLVDIAAIYRLEGNKLTVSFRFGTTRPSEFRTQPTVETMILIFERAKR
jgi:uncharacterized protein (TIGR03067 family)